MKYKIHGLGLGFTNKRINLVWMQTVVGASHSFCPANGYHGRPGKKEFKQEGFGDINYCLIFLNSMTAPEPHFVAVNGVKSPFREWFIPA